MRAKILMRWISLILSSLGLMVASTSSAWSATYYIDFGSGSNSNNGTSPSTPWKGCPGDSTNCTANCASATLTAGDKVIFKGGVSYLGQITLNWGGTGDADANRIIYDGDSGTYVTRWAAENAKAIIDGENTRIYLMIASGGKNYITINNFEMKNTVSDASHSGAIEAQGISATYFKITNCIIHNTGPIIDDPTGSAVTLSSNNWVINGNYFYDCGKICIYANNSPSNLEIKNNTLEDRTAWGICIAENGAKTLDNIQIHHNTFNNISSYYAARPPHNNNIMAFVQGGAGTFSNWQIYDNYFYTAPGTASGGTGTITIQIATVGAKLTGCEIYNNVFANTNANEMIYISTAGRYDHVYIYNNSAWSSVSGVKFLHIEDAVGGYPNVVYVKNNSATTTQYPLFLWDHTASWTDLQINYNNWNTSSPNIAYYNGALKTWSQWRALGFDAQSYGPTSDPLYINTSNAPFNLRMRSSSSPLYHHGFNLGSPYDIDHSGIPRTSTWDIGAYQFKGPPLAPSNLRLLP